MRNRELRDRLANEYLYAAKKMQGSPQILTKLFYFSVTFGEATRILNFEWDRDLALVLQVTQQAYNNIMAAYQNPTIESLPIDWTKIMEELNQTELDLAAYMATVGDKSNAEELCKILGRISELSYIVSGNGAYLYDKGLIKL